MWKLLHSPRIRRVFLLPLHLIIATIFLSSPAATFARTWKSSNGTYSVDAEFLESKDGVVSLRKANDSVIRVPIRRLCPEDQAYVAEQSATGGPKSAISPPRGTI